MVTMSGLFTVAMVMVTALAWLSRVVRASRASRFTGGSSGGTGPGQGRGGQQRSGVGDSGATSGDGLT
ncbi:hypothetical protein GCM10010844_24550 [Deinococcus radiotolerans]|uniref:Secreted protein n=1 Tax=Deinococcus radiotolerans TaxID=1309407 RepID=A0ABQ2FJT2_9DEIO|nr:hypothetical protein GCM10010844_24550 [Deinococcus radiotolerans]